VFHEINLKAGCDSQMDFMRFALMHRIITWADEMFNFDDPINNLFIRS